MDRNLYTVVNEQKPLYSRNLVESTYGRFCIKFPQSRMEGERHRLSSFYLFKMDVAHMAEYVSLKRDNSYLNKGRLLLIKLINRDYRIHVLCIYIEREFHITS
jgi:hypothetical protein